VSYTEPVFGWSIRYPSTWIIDKGTAEGTVGFISTNGALIAVIPAFDLDPAVVSSEDMLVNQLGAALGRGVIDESFNDLADALVPSLPAEECREQPDCRSWYLDIDYSDIDPDGLGGPGNQDITAFQVTLILDLEALRPISADRDPTSWWYFYAVPDGDTGFVIVTTDHDEELILVADDIVRSFEPPDGYPHLNPPDP